MLAPPADFTPDVAAARAYAASRPGTVAFAVRTEDDFWGSGEDGVFPAASVLKAMLLVAYARAHDDRAFTPPRRRCSTR